MIQYLKIKHILYSPGCIKEGDINYPGHDIGQHIQLESQQACAEHCVSVEGGLFWTYSYSTNNCYVKSSDSGRRTQGGGLVSGTQACGLVQKLIPLGVAVSQRWKDKYPPHKCVNSNNLNFCVVAKAPFPWLAIYLGSKARVDKVEIWNRRDCCGKGRLRNFEVRVTDSLPSSGTLCLNTDVFPRGREVRRGNTGWCLQWQRRGWRADHNGGLRNVS